MSRVSPLGEPYKAQGGAPKIILTSQQHVSSLGGDIYLMLSYQPDRTVVTAAQFTEWANQAATTDWKTWEELATAMVEGFYDEILPFFVSLQLDISEKEGVTHSVTLTRQQPAAA